MIPVKRLEGANALSIFHFYSNFHFHCKMTPKLTLFHGSKHLFDRFSNDFHLSGYGLMSHGWGIYLTPDIDLAIYFSGYFNVMRCVWVIDEQPYFNEHINTPYPFSIDTDEDLNRLAVTYDRLHDFNWQQNIIDALEKGVSPYFQFETREQERIFRKELEKVMLLLKAAKQVSIKMPKPFYLYLVEVAPRRIFKNVRDIEEKHRKAVNRLLRHEKHGFSIPTPIDYKDHELGFYQYLERRFRERYKHSPTKRDRINQITSLFLYRVGFDMMYLPHRDEYVLFNTSRATILDMEGVGISNEQIDK